MHWPCRRPPPSISVHVVCFMMLRRCLAAATAVPLYCWGQLKSRNFERELQHRMCGRSTPSPTPLSNILLPLFSQQSQQYEGVQPLRLPLSQCTCPSALNMQLLRQRTSAACGVPCSRRASECLSVPRSE